MKHTREDGFTLAEVMVALSLTVVTSAIAGTLCVRSLQVTDTLQTRAFVEGRLLDSAQRVTRDVQQASSTAVSEAGVLTVAKWDGPAACTLATWSTKAGAVTRTAWSVTAPDDVGTLCVPATAVAPADARTHALTFPSDHASVTFTAGAGEGFARWTLTAQPAGVKSPMVLQSSSGTRCVAPCSPGTTPTPTPTPTPTTPPATPRPPWIQPPCAPENQPCPIQPPPAWW